MFTQVEVRMMASEFLHLLPQSGEHFKVILFRTTHVVIIHILTVSLNVHQQMAGQRSYGMYSQWESALKCEKDWTTWDGIGGDYTL